MEGREATASGILEASKLQRLSQIRIKRAFGV